MAEDQTSRVQAPAPDRARRSLAGGVAVFRWLAYAWMVIGNLIETESFERPELAWAGIGVAGAWTLFVTAGRHRHARAVLAVDLALGIGLILLGGYVVAPGSVIGDRLFYTATYPVGTALALGEARGPWGGLAAAVILGVALLYSRVTNGIALDLLTARDAARVVNGAASYLLAGLAGGYTARYLQRWASEHQTLLDAAMEAQARASRLAERQALARRIHDSVLQALTMIAKRGTELARLDSIPPRDVARLAQTARDQEKELRALVMRAPEDAPTGQASLRDALERIARGTTDVGVSVSSVGPIWLTAHAVDEISAAVAQALRNVEQHAKASTAVVFADLADGALTVSVRDDGSGFVFDEASLRDAGKAGILRSMKGRIQDLGGSMVVRTELGAGCEIEFTIPADGVVPGGAAVR